MNRSKINLASAFHNHGPEFVRKFGLALIEAAAKLEHYSKEKSKPNVQS